MQCYCIHCMLCCFSFVLLTMFIVILDCGIQCSRVILKAWTHDATLRAILHVVLLKRIIFYCSSIVCNKLHCATCLVISIAYKTVFSEVSFNVHVCASAPIYRSSDVDLILSDSAFLQKSAVQKRHLMCPGW